jgi:dCMP deaminase
MDLKWHMRFMDVAKLVSTWSKDPSTQIGAVIVDPVSKRILSTGYNGFPKGIEDTEERLNDKEEKHKYVVHAEMNAIYNATNIGVPLNDSYLYVWGLPVCSECAKGVIQAGISLVVVSSASLYLREKWRDSFTLSRTMFREANVEWMAIGNE